MTACPVLVQCWASAGTGHRYRVRAPATSPPASNEVPRTAGGQGTPDTRSQTDAADPYTVSSVQCVEAHRIEGRGKWEDGVGVWKP